MKNHLFQKDAGQGLDAFLDIITNVIGVLILIASLIAMQIRDFQPDQKAPLTKRASRDQVLRLFVCSKGVVAELSHAAIKHSAEKAANDHLGSRQTWQEFAEFVNARDDWSDTFSVQVETYQSGVVEFCYEKRKPSQEESSGWEESFRGALSSLNENEYVFFRVFPDSFPAFRKARQIAKEAGYQIGWKPFGGEELCFVVRNPNPNSNTFRIPIEVDL